VETATRHVEFEPRVQLTPRALAKIALLAEEVSPSERGVRIFARAGEGWGTDYGMSFDTVRPADLVLQQDGWTLLVDGESVRLLGTLVVDYRDSAERGGFVFHRRPEPEAACGCEA
jgi:iron-sulfur cluster assembly accessory protein